MMNGVTNLASGEAFFLETLIVDYGKMNQWNLL